MIGDVPTLVQASFELLRSADVAMQPGLDSTELTAVEQRFGITFGPEHRELIQLGVPSGPKWPNWRHEDDDLRTRLAWPFNGIWFAVENNDFWPKSWGRRPSQYDDRLREARERFAALPGLVPLYSHRYLPSDPRYRPAPVFSVHQTDVIYYGANLLDYVQREFGARSQAQSRAVSGRCRHVRFWADLAMGAGSADL